MHWQSLLLVHSALSVRQPGKITRLTSGCSNEAQREAARRSTLHPAVAFFAAPLPESIKTYHWANRPFALREWFLHQPQPVVGTVAILDPDMVFLAPLALPHSVGRRHLAAGQVYAMGAELWARASWTAKALRTFNLCTVPGICSADGSTASAVGIEPSATTHASGTRRLAPPTPDSIVHGRG